MSRTPSPRRSRPRVHTAAVLAVGVVAALAASAGRADAQETERPRVLVLGFDGADATLTQQYLDEGRLPNLKRLGEQGAWSPLWPTNRLKTPDIACQA